MRYDGDHQGEDRDSANEPGRRELSSTGRSAPSFVGRRGWGARPRGRSGCCASRYRMGTVRRPPNGKKGEHSVSDLATYSACGGKGKVLRSDPDDACSAGRTEGESQVVLNGVQ